jgi:endonuclease/exonuclease/phosphatase (EEP) superfamily protein YafD
VLLAAAAAASRLNIRDGRASLRRNKALAAMLSDHAPLIVDYDYPT